MPFYQFRKSLLLALPMCALLGPAVVAGKAYANNANVESVRDCEQDDKASLALRACTRLLGDNGMEPAERGRIYTLRGVAWMTEDDPAAAASDFGHAIELDAKNVRAIRTRAKAYTLLGNHDLSTADWSRLVELYPGTEEFYRHRGSSLLAAGKPDEAMADFNKSIALDAKSMEAYIGRALVYDFLGDREKTLKEFAGLFEINPGYIPAHWAKAQAAERWGDKKLAIESYSTLLKYNGVYANARKALVRLGIHTPP